MLSADHAGDFPVRGLEDLKMAAVAAAVNQFLADGGNELPVYPHDFALVGYEKLGDIECPGIVGVKLAYPRNNEGMGFFRRLTQTLRCRARNFHPVLDQLLEKPSHRLQRVRFLRGKPEFRVTGNERFGETDYHRPLVRGLFYCENRLVDRLVAIEKYRRCLNRGDFEPWIHI